MNKQGKIAVLGDKDCTLAFKAVGLESYGAENESEAKDVLRRLTKENYAVIFITEDIAVKIPDVLEAFRSCAFPVIIPIPSASVNNGFCLDYIRKNVERALGVNIFFDE